MANAIAAWGEGAFRGRPLLAATSLYAVLALAFFGQALTPGRTLSTSDQLWLNPPWAASPPPSFLHPANFASPDFPLAFRPWASYTRRELPSVPLWNPYVMGGRPFIGNAQSAVFSPFSLPAFVLPFGFAIGFIAALKVWAAALGTFLLARAVGIRGPAAFMAGIVYGFGLPLVTWVLILAPASAWALIPWVLLACQHLVDRPGVRATATLGVTVALELLAGSPESSFHALAAGTAFFGFQVVSAEGRRPWREVAKPVSLFAAAVLWGFALAAVAVVPFVELLAHSNEAADRGLVHVAADRQYLAALAFPDYWGRYSGLAGGSQTRFIYVGALPLMLALVALIRPTVRRAAGAAAGATALMVAFGVGPAFHLANVIPGFAQADNTRLTVLFGLCIALLAGAGLQDLSSGRLSGRRRVVAPGIGVVILLTPCLWIATRWPSTPNLRGAFSVAWKATTPPADIAVVRLSSLILWTTWATLGLVLLAAWSLGLLRRGLAPAAVAFVCLDLFRAGMGFNPAIRTSEAVQPATSAIRFLQSRRPERFAGVGVLPPNVAMTYGLFDARGYDFPIERRYARLWQAVNPFLTFARGQSVAYKIDNLTPRGLRALNLLAVADVIVPPHSPAPKPPGLRIAYRGKDADVYANRGAVPRVFVVGGSQVASDGEAALADVLRPRFNPRNTVVTEHPIPALRGNLGPAGRARIVELSPERVGVMADVTRPGMLVLADISYPGWRTYVDGRPAPVQRVDYLLRGVVLGAGRHHVTFTYRPPSWRAAQAFTFLALLALGMTALTALRRRT